MKIVSLITKFMKRSHLFASSGLLVAALFYPITVSAQALTWTTKASMPVSRGMIGTTVGNDGNIYVAGGKSNGPAYSNFMEYSVASDAWTAKTAAPELARE